MSVLAEFDRLRCMMDQETFNERHANYERYQFQRGWNAAFRFVLEKMELIERGDSVIAEFDHNDTTGNL